MPIYEYECEKCGAIEEALQKFSDPPRTSCTKCSGKLHKLVSQSSFHLKGSGWYVTDYAAKGPSKADTASKTETKGTADTAKAKTPTSPKTDKAK
jgi:putative FmdB family regulatory protein